MHRFAVFLDAGYFFAAGSQAICGSAVSRRNISVRAAPDLIAALAERASAQCGNTALLRVYWYDAIQGPRMSLEHSALAHQAGVKLRLGTLNNAGEQKGVDSLIVTDLIELARNKAIIDAIVVSGDEDLRVAVQVAQTFGVRVHVLAVGDASKNVSASLQMEADSVETLGKDWLEKHLTVVVDQAALPKRQLAPVAVPSLGGMAPSLEEAAAAVADELLRDRPSHEADALRAHFAGNQTVPPEFDRKLIAKTAKLLQRQLEPAELRKVRGVFVNTVRARRGSTAGVV